MAVFDFRAKFTGCFLLSVLGPKNTWLPLTLLLITILLFASIVYFSLFSNYIVILYTALFTLSHWIKIESLIVNGEQWSPFISYNLHYLTLIWFNYIIFGCNPIPSPYKVCLCVTIFNLSLFIKQKVLKLMENNVYL